MYTVDACINTKSDTNKQSCIVVNLVLGNIATTINTVKPRYTCHTILLRNTIIPYSRNVWQRESLVVDLVSLS